MKYLAIDTETKLISPGNAAPHMVCTTYANDSAVGLLHWTQARSVWRRWLCNDNLTLSAHNMPFDSAVVCATFPNLLDLVIEKYAKRLMRCSLIDTRLNDIRNGCLGGRHGKRYTYGLGPCVERVTGEHVAKGMDTWRLRYKELLAVPTSRWPEDAKFYAIKDAKLHWLLHKRLRHSSVNSAFEAEAAFYLYLMTCRGIRTDGEACRKLIDATQAELDRARQLCVDNGLIDAKGTKKLKAARERFISFLPSDTRAELDDAISATKAYTAKAARDSRQRVMVNFGLSEKLFRQAERRLEKLLTKDIPHEQLIARWNKSGYSEQLYVALRSLVRKPRPFKALGVTLTKTGMVSVKAQVVRESGDSVLMAFATATSANTLLKKAQLMALGEHQPLQTSYVSPIASGRTSSHGSGALIGDNFQNFRRGPLSVSHGEAEADVVLPGQRECIIARTRYVLCSIDLPNAEMRGYAQIEYSMFGRSHMRDVLNRGENAHRALGAFIMGLPLDEFERRYKAGDQACIDAAQFAKVPNFALLGGGGWRILPDYALGMGIKLSNAKAQELYEAFHAKWETVKLAHKEFAKWIHKVHTHPVTKFERYLDRYAQACNHQFQHIIAYAAKNCVVQVGRHCYHSNGKLRGMKPLLFLHDEILSEVRKRNASELAWRACGIMERACAPFMPDVPMRPIEPALMERFSKGAKTVTHKTRKDSDGNPLLMVT